MGSQSSKEPAGNIIWLTAGKQQRPAEKQQRSALRMVALIAEKQERPAENPTTRCGKVAAPCGKRGSAVRRSSARNSSALRESGSVAEKDSEEGDAHCGNPKQRCAPIMAAPCGKPHSLRETSQRSALRKATLTAGNQTSASR